MEKYDSTNDTMEHIEKVKAHLGTLTFDLAERYGKHDRSKLNSPEKEIFDEYTPKLKDCTYGSDEYKGYLKEMKPALDHHYAANDHHPEHFPNGIKDMDLTQLSEMVCDWMAACERHADGDIRKSIELNQERFGYSDELKQIFHNTVNKLEEKK